MIDGSKALRNAIAQTFGQCALIRRRQEHMRRNVLARLPEDAHASVKRALKDAWKPALLAALLSCNFWVGDLPNTLGQIPHRRFKFLGGNGENTLFPCLFDPAWTLR